MRVRRFFVRSWAVVVLVASLVGSAVALTAIFGHTFPPVTVTPAVLTTTCSTLTLSQTTVIAGTSGSIVARCDALPGITVASAGAATPSFNLPSGYTELGLFPDTGSPYCSRGMPGFIELTSGISVSFDSAGQRFDYCLSYSSPTGSLASFSVSWGQ